MNTVTAVERHARLKQIDRQLATRRPRVDPWRQMVAAEREREQTLLHGHQQRVERTEFEIMRLERKGRTWWTPTDTDRYVELCQLRDRSREWLSAHELDAELRDRGRRAESFIG
jgi:hypothetical protein